MAKKSKLDVHHDFIVMKLAEGASYYEIADALYFEKDVEITEGAISNYVNKHGLKSKYAEYVMNVPHCKTCSHCMKVKKAYNTKETQLICLAEKKMLRSTVWASPDWCPLREVGNGNIE